MQHSKFIKIPIEVTKEINVNVKISINIRHKGFKKDCPDGELTEAGFIKIYTQVKYLSNFEQNSFVTKSFADML